MRRAPDRTLEAARTQLSGTALPPGTPAPDFSLPSTVDGPLGPRDRRGRPLILVFYPADWSPVCTDQLALYQEVMPEFERHDAALFGLSVDGPWSHLAFAKDRHLRFPLLADFEPKGEVARTTASIGRRTEPVSARSS
jgi:Peroxiredoxin